jgi:hypothetical protein
MREAQTYVRLLLAVAVAYAGWIFLSRALTSYQRRHHEDSEQAARNAEFLRIYGGSDVKILQFYAREGSVTEGSKSVICYGVLNAVSVRMEPPVEGVAPSLNKCVDVAPERQTRYTLFAEGKGGQVISESFTLGVEPDADALPKITSFEVKSQSIDYRGRPVYLVSFTAENPEEVSFDPPVLPNLHRAPYGRLYVAPEKTTTYTLTVTGKFGHKAQRQLTLEGPKE